MKPKQKIAAIVLIVLLGATAFGLFREGRQVTAPAVSRKLGQAAPAQATLVDQSPLTTAQQLARLANTQEEQPLAQEALRLSDYEVDLAFDAALHNAKEHPPVLKGDAKEIADRLQRAQAVLADEQAKVDQLTQAAAKASGDKKEKLNDDVAVKQEDLNLAQDEVDDAKQDLIRAGGDPESRIQEMQKAHKDTEKNSQSSIASISYTPEPPGLIHRVEQWSALHGKQLQLWQAKGHAEAAAISLTAQHNALDAKIEQEKLSSPNLASHAKKPMPGGASGTSPASAPAPAPRAASTMPANRTHEEASELVEQ